MSDIVSRLRQGGGKPSNDDALLLLAEAMGWDVNVLLAIDEVESAGRSFDDQGRLIILPEKHVFWRELPKGLRNKARALGLATPKWRRANYKGLGRSGSDARWDRLEAMARLHETAGLKSASYGGKQIMGFNHSLCGFPDVQSFALAFAESEAAQQEAFVRFLKAVGLDQAIRDRDWRAIARRYNGSGQVSYYARLLRDAYNRLVANTGGAVSPEPENTMLRLGSEGYRVKALQEKLVSLGYHLKVDGDFGPATRRQVVAFQIDGGLQPDGVVGPNTEKALDLAVPINQQPGNSRTELTVKELRKSGSKTIKQADRVTAVGVTAVGTGTIAKTLETFAGEGGAAGLETLKGVSGLITEVSGYIDPVLSLIGDNKWLALTAIGLAVWYFAGEIKKRRLHDAREWRHVG